MRGSSRILSTLTTSALAAFALIASAEEAASPATNPLSADLASTSPAAPVEPPAAEAAPSATIPHLLGARLGSGRTGTTRLVLETDQPAEFLAVELADRAGVELRLLGTGANPPPAPIEVSDGRVRRVTFVTGPRDVLVRVESAGPRLKSRTFALHDPPRGVVDIELAQSPAVPAGGAAAGASAASAEKTSTGADSEGGAKAPSKAKPAAPDAPHASTPHHSTPKTPPAPAASPTSSAAPASVSAAAPPALRDSSLSFARFVDPKGAPPATPAAASSDEPSFDDFLKWVDEFRENAEAIRPDTPEEEKVRRWRKLAALLHRRGLVEEAERTLSRALQSGAQDTVHAYGDSLRLAEMRLTVGRPKDASLVAAKLSSFGRSTEEKLRLARIHADCGSPMAARGILEEVLPRVSAGKKPGAQLLLARCFWDLGSSEKALAALDAIDRDAALSGEVEQGSTVLRADCYFALGRTAEAGAAYRRATAFELSPEESAWVRLQLGNLAHREGRLEDAKSMYREASTGWPDTFYASQAAWFLQAAERLDSIEARREEAGRG